MTFNSCIKKEIIDKIEPYGFKRAKSKYPYWVRRIGNDVIQVITYMNDWCIKPQNDFSIWGGIASVYRKKINLDIHPKEQKWWMIDARACFAVNDYEIYKRIVDSGGKIDNAFVVSDEIDMQEKVSYAVDLCAENLIPAFNKIKTIKDCILFNDYYHCGDMSILSFRDMSTMRDENEGALIIKEFQIDDFIDRMERSFQETNEKNRELFKKNIGDGYLDIYNEDYELRKERKNQAIALFKEIKSNNEMKVQIENELNKRKKDNINNMIKWGLY